MKWEPGTEVQVTSTHKDPDTCKGCPHASQSPCPEEEYIGKTGFVLDGPRDSDFGEMYLVGFPEEKRVKVMLTQELSYLNSTLVQHSSVAMND